MTVETFGDNVQVEIKANKMTITVDLNKDLGASKSGKTIGIATTRGNHKFTGPNGVQMALGLNCYRYPDKS